jgi:hypothetical protein
VIRDNEVYLGDGLYGSFDGYQIKLRAPRGYVDDEVFLDVITLAAFQQWLKALQGQNYEQTQEASRPEAGNHGYQDAPDRQDQAGGPQLSAGPLAAGADPTGA